MITHRRFLLSYLMIPDRSSWIEYMECTRSDLESSTFEQLLTTLLWLVMDYWLADDFGKFFVPVWLTV